MAIIGNRAMTLADIAKRLDPNGSQAKIIEILSQTNEILDDALWLEANGPTFHRTTVRNGLPDAYWRSLNRGVPKSKSSTAQVDDVIGSLEVYAETDKDIVNLNGNTPQARLGEEAAFIEAMNQKMASSLFYGNNAADPASFTGLALRYNTLDREKAASAENVVSLGGGAPNAQTSVWLAVWGDNTCHCLYPKGSKAGLQIQDKGVETIQDADGNQYEAYRSHYEWKAGLSVRDWRYAVRIANVNVADLAAIIAGGAGQAANQALVRAMITAYNKVPNIRAGNAAWYMNRTVKAMLDIMAAEKGNVNLTMERFEGECVTTFKGVPVRQCDAILDTEAVVA